MSRDAIASRGGARGLREPICDREYAMAARPVGVATGLFGLVLTLTGCSSTVDAADVETQISDQLEAQLGEAPDSVDCPEDLPAEEGAEIRCELTVAEETLGVTVTVTSVADNTVNFDIQVDE